MAEGAVAASGLLRPMAGGVVTCRGLRLRSAAAAILAGSARAVGGGRVLVVAAAILSRAFECGGSGRRAPEPAPHPAPPASQPTPETWRPSASVRAAGPGWRAARGALRAEGRLREGGRGGPSGGGGGRSLPSEGRGGCVVCLWAGFMNAGTGFLPPFRRAAVGRGWSERPRLGLAFLPVLGWRCRGGPRAPWWACGSGASSAKNPF